MTAITNYNQYTPYSCSCQLEFSLYTFSPAEIFGFRLRSKGEKPNIHLLHFFFGKLELADPQQAAANFPAGELILG